ncbi:MAG: hypothetical protein RLZZ592_1898 [Pseudomonadota bacterium]|jgi:pilus assembly protein Flp/PilA
MNMIKNFLRDEDGVTAIEYGLLAALIAVAIITATTTLGKDIAALFSGISSKITAVTPK